LEKRKTETDEPPPLTIDQVNASLSLFNPTKGAKDKALSGDLQLILLKEKIQNLNENWVVIDLKCYWRVENKM